jgi:hypothetical protein
MASDSLGSAIATKEIEMKRAKKTTLVEKRATIKARGMKNPSGNSKYGRKHAYCVKNKVWGFEVPEPKPWK